jgi:hypothetical protein
MVKRIAMGIILACLVAMPTVAQDFEKGLAAAMGGDYAAAVKQWRPLAAKGHAKAQSYLGFMYLQGRGVPQDHAQALKWYKKAAAQGDARALIYLRKRKGQGASQTKGLAVLWLSLSSIKRSKNGPTAQDVVAKSIKPAEPAKDRKKAKVRQGLYDKK